MAALQVRDIDLLNADYQSLGKITFKKAVRLLSKGKAVVEEVDSTKKQFKDWGYPKVVRLLSFVKINYKKLYGTPLFSKSGVLKRDKHICAYCRKTAKTIDHVLPRSRGGKNDYSNTVAACFPCNNKKDNKTPQEAGMPLLWAPYVPTKIQLMQGKY